MAIDSKLASCEQLPLTLHSRHVLAYSRLLSSISGSLQSELLEALRDAHHSPSFLLAYRMLSTFYSMTSSLQIINIVLNEMNLLNIESVNSEKLVHHIGRVLAVFRQLAIHTHEMGMNASETYEALTCHHRKCLKMCLKTHSIVNCFQKKTEIVSGDLVSFNVWLYLALQGEQSAKFGYSLLKVANLFFLPVRLIIEPPFVDKWLDDARNDYHRATQVTDDVMHQRLVVVDCHTRVTHRFSEAVASNRHAERALQTCKESIAYLFRSAHRWYHIHGVLNQMCDLWTRLMTCCRLLHLAQYRDNERSEFYKELLHTVKVLSNMFLFDHIEARNDWLKMMNL